MARGGRHGIVAAEAAANMRAALASMSRVPAEVRRLIHDTAADQLSRAWGEELDKRPAFNAAQEKFVKHGHEALPSASGLWLYTGHGSLARPFEFGTNNREATKRYKAPIGKNKKRVTVTRRTRRQIPPRKADGWIAYPAARASGRRVMAMWAQIAHKVTHDWMEGKL